MLGFLLLAALGAWGCAHTPSKTPTVAIGDFELVDLDGRPRKLAEFKGQILLIDFWASWCVPCKDSLPVYSEWQKEWGERDFRVLAISVDEDEAKIAPFAARYAPNLLVLHDRGGQLASTLDLATMPMAFLVDREQMIVDSHAGFRTGDDEIVREKILRLLHKE